MREQLAKLREWFEKLAPRERKLVGVLLGMVLVGLVFVAPVAASIAISSRSEANQALESAITRVKESRDEIARRKAKREAIAQRYANRPPALAGLIEKAARDNKIEVTESLDRPETPHGKKYVERTTVVRLRKPAMLGLARMLEQLEQQKMPLAISRLSIRRRGGEPDAYDVELGLSAYDRNESKEAKTNGAAAPAPAGGSTK